MDHIVAYENFGMAFARALCRLVKYIQQHAAEEDQENSQKSNGKTRQH